MQVTLLNNTDIPGANEDFGGAIIYAARTCYSSYAAQDRASDKKLLKHLVINEESPLEFATFHFHITGISRACSHQIVRHRISSFAQKSQRYVSEEGFEHVTPPAIEQGIMVVEGYTSSASELFEECMDYIKDVYSMLIEMGIKKEDARFVLPNACTTELIYQANLRSLRNFWRLRLKPGAQWEIRRVALETLALIYKVNPLFIVSKDDFFESALEAYEK